jgi:hypothetical protein
MLKNPILTSRFNNETFKENTLFRERRRDIGCIYGSPSMLNDTYELNSLYFVIEMNNQLNRVEGIGLITNYAILSESQYDIYKDQNYNRYNYIGKNRIVREDFNTIEEAVFKALDQLCFYGNEHMKRGNGLKAFPTKLLVNCKDVLDIPAFLDNMFTSRFS